MNQYFKITEEHLIPIKGKDLSNGFTFYIKQENGEFHRAVVQLEELTTKKMLEEYRLGIKKLSEEGRLFSRRDKKGKDFRDLL
jgi:hypothetical protein